jgi:hypothetical protein
MLDIEVSDRETFIIYPNPSSGTITIRATLKKDQVIPIAIVSEAGHLLYKDEGQTSGKLMIKTINLGDNIPNGTYLLRLAVEGGTQDLKFVIRR